MVNTNFVFNTALSPKEIELHELVQGLLLVLSEKEKYIIESRFALDMKKRLTLEEIGGHFGLTRERIRQIEKSALRKLERNAQNTNVKTLTDFAKALLEREGGLMRDKEFKKELLALLPNIDQEEIQDLHLALVLDPNIHFESNTLKFHPHWHLHRISRKDIQKASTKTIQTLGKAKELIPLKELKGKIDVDEQALKQIINISKDLKLTEKGVGLLSWRHVHPRTLRDKICFVLNQEKRPLHFQKIADLIEKSSFDQKNVNIQAIHNELIRNENFVLIGRGIYALKDWGFQTGTVADVIERILEDGQARTREEITAEVLKQRHVKSITIYLNLKNQEKFSRIGRNRYTLASLAEA